MLLRIFDYISKHRLPTQSATIPTRPSKYSFEFDNVQCTTDDVHPEYVSFCGYNVVSQLIDTRAQIKPDSFANEYNTVSL